ncbi:hypothetical protein [Campylobacter lari]|uniref:hypothetical protein n=1 Tax=Campylobacter lari TaxID=201 RepID=UPI002149EF5D|nr:hypothetical protein [Campylobacter lari]MCR2075869.1 hypothetical protein [Campylobacter lari subsp. concheus]MCR2083904.1 hypothetical protein [Campylobacter lari subsp. concheus]MCR2085529.1 hypothetical protein [Campylobacter lari subsp. concheus]
MGRNKALFNSDNGYVVERGNDIKVYYICLSDLEDNSKNQITLAFVFILLYITFVLVFCLKEEFEKSSYDFISKFNKTLEIELKYELEKKLIIVLISML